MCGSGKGVAPRDRRCASAPIRRPLAGVLPARHGVRIAPRATSVNHIRLLARVTDDGRMNALEVPAMKSTRSRFSAGGDRWPPGRLAARSAEHATGAGGGERELHGAAPDCAIAVPAGPGCASAHTRLAAEPDRTPSAVRLMTTRYSARDTGAQPGNGRVSRYLQPFARFATAGPERLLPEPRLFAWGMFWLALGFLIYATARPATALAFLPHSSNPAALPHWLKVALGPAPSFVHVTAFALMSGAH